MTAQPFIHARILHEMRRVREVSLHQVVRYDYILIYFNLIHGP